MAPRPPATERATPPVLSVAIHATTAVYPLDRDLRAYRGMQASLPTPVLTVHVPPDGVSRRQLARLWDEVTLTSLEEDAVAALRLIAPGVERLTLIGDRPGARTPFVRVAGARRPVPLGSMGDGMNRVLGVVLALVNARDGVLLVDEVENGIHYTVLPDLWRLLFRTAHRLNVQVFASTHSWDCIQAFQLAAADDPYEEAALIRLEAGSRGTRSTVFGEDDLGVVLREHLEVR